MVLTANGKVHTHEEAQVFVHDVTATLEEAPAVLPLGKLCEEHGYSCEWVSGRKPLFVDQRREAKRTISYLLSFQGYPPILEAFRLPHRHRKTHRVDQVQYESEVTE